MSYKLYDAEIEYLEGTGTQYINLGTTLNSSTDVVDLEICMTQELAGAYKVFGARSGASEKNFSLITSNPNSICIDLQNATYSTYRVTYTYEVGVYYTIHMERTLRRVSSNGVTIAEKTNESQSFTTAGDAYLFSFNQAGNNWMLAPCRIKSLTWRRSGLNFIDLTPVRVGNVGYMYDKVSGKLFGNSGTGSFVLGPDVAPAAYANEIAFLESTGSQYIDTGIVPTGDLRLTVDGFYPTATDNGLIHGCIDLDGSTYRRFHLGISGVYWQGGIGTTVNSSGSPDTSRHVFQITGRGTAYIDAFVINGDATAFPSIPMYLFARNFSGTASNMGRFRIYGANIYRYSTDEKIADFIPVEYNNIGYLYDKVSGKFFANQGTGKFVLGHRAPRFDGKACARSYTRRQLMMEAGKPPYIQDGLVFWLDGINKGASDGTWVEKIHGTVFSGNATSVDKGFNFSRGQRMFGSWVNGTSNNFTVEVCYYTTRTGSHFVWGVGTNDTKTPLYMDNNGPIATIQNLNVFARPSSFSSNKTVSINQDRGIYSGVNMTKSGSIDWWVASPNGSTVNIGKGYAGVALNNPLTGIIYAIRVYNRRLTAEEMLYNQRIDNKRFDLGLNI